MACPLLWSGVSLDAPAAHDEHRGGIEMTRHDVVRTILAALLILGVGVAFAVAESLEVRVKRVGTDHTVIVDADGITEELSLGDLADGEEREITAGDHTVTVRRDGDRLEALLDGEPITAPATRTMVWVGDDGVTHEVSGGDHKVIVLRDDDADEGEARVFTYKISDGELSEDVDIDVEEIRRQIEAGEIGETFDVEVNGPHVVMKSGEGHPTFVTSHAFHGDDRVMYRCEETGSELIVKADDALLDSYIDPVTGCLMEKVETPEVRVVTIVEERVDEDE